MERKNENCASDNFNYAKTWTATEALSMDALIKNTTKKTLRTQHLPFHPVLWRLLWDSEFIFLFKQHISQVMKFQRSTDTAKDQLWEVQQQLQEFLLRFTAINRFIILSNTKSWNF